MHGNLYRDGLNCDPMRVDSYERSNLDGFNCGKHINVNGRFSMVGVARTAHRRLGGAANVGDTQITLESPTDWTSGDILVITAGSHQKWEMRLNVASVSPDGLVVTLEEPLTQNYVGQAIPLPRNGARIDHADMAARVALLTRNVQLLSGHDPIVDYVYGVSPYSMFYGTTMTARAAATVRDNNNIATELLVADIDFQHVAVVGSGKGVRVVAPHGVSAFPFLLPESKLAGTGSVRFAGCSVYVTAPPPPLLLLLLLLLLRVRPPLPQLLLLQLTNYW